jgi:hypothetical protein
MEGDPVSNNPDPTTAAGNGGTLDPQRAAALLDQATRQARRRLEPAPPWLLATRAVMIAIVCGAIWLSVRDQHPYRGPTDAVLPVVFAFVVVNLAATVTVARRATAGVSGRSRLRPAEIGVLALAWLAVFVVMGILAGAGVSRAIVYGTYPATVPLIVAGLAWAAVMAVHANRRSCRAGLAIAAVGAVGALAGPAGAWAVAGAGLLVVLLVNAAVIARQQRRSAVRP